jgi:hypothetical protein
MIKGKMLLLLLCLACSSCKSTPEQAKEQSETISSGAVSDDDGFDAEETGEIKVIPIFSKCENYDNNLSTVASEVKFVLPDAEPPFNDFHIYDVQTSDDYIFFLSGLYNIVQYDYRGKFIRSIGSRGMGPEEYIQLEPPLLLDNKNNLVYASDIRDRTLVYHFNGIYKDVLPIGGCMAITDSSTIVLRQALDDRYIPECPSIRFFDRKGNHIKSYRSSLYPMPRAEMEIFGPEVSFLWENKDKSSFWEYGSDTIYRIRGDAIIPKWIVAGNLKPNKKELFSRNTGQKLRNFSYILRPNSGVFESDHFMIFNMSDDYEKFYMIYDKSTDKIHRTFYKNAREIITNPRKNTGYKKMDYFIDDMVSGLHFNPQYQSQDRAIALIPASEVVERRDDILRFIAQHPSNESAHLKTLIEDMDEFDNALIMMVAFK